MARGVWIVWNTGPQFPVDFFCCKGQRFVWLTITLFLVWTTAAQFTPCWTYMWLTLSLLQCKRTLRLVGTCHWRPKHMIWRVHTAKCRSEMITWSLGTLHLEPWDGWGWGVQVPHLALWCNSQCLQLPPLGPDDTLHCLSWSSSHHNELLWWPHPCKQRMSKRVIQELYGYGANFSFYRLGLCYRW